MQTMRVSGSAVGILSERPATEQRDEHTEDQDVEADADEEERLVQEPALGLQDRVMADGVTAGEHMRGVRPIPEGVAEFRKEGQRDHPDEQDNRQRLNQQLPVTTDEGRPTGIKDAGDHREE